MFLWFLKMAPETTSCKLIFILIQLSEMRGAVSLNNLDPFLLKNFLYSVVKLKKENDINLYVECVWWKVIRTA